MTPEISAFGEVLLYLVGGTVFVCGGLFTARLIRPKRPNEEKLTTYESGEEPIGSAWAQFNVRFYVIALIFLLFEVEVVFLFPWAIVFSNKEYIEATDGTWGWYTLIEMFVFIFILVLGLAYAWSKGHLDWQKPEIKASGYKGKVPVDRYEAINEKYE